jgi:hypothetical protein
MRPRSLFVALLGLAALGAAFLRLRRPPRARARVELYLEDGSSVSFEAGTPEGARLLSLADEVRAAAR